jgi:hypothetical protein
MNHKQLTVVFNVVDDKGWDALWQAHQTNTPIHGLMPSLLSWGDQVRVPGEITMALADIDPEYPDIRELKGLVNMADKHLREG